VLEALLAGNGRCEMGDAVLLNIYHVIEVNPVKWPKVNVAGAKAFADFMVSKETQDIIKTFGEQTIELTAMNGISFASLDGKILRLMKKGSMQNMKSTRNCQGLAPKKDSRVGWGILLRCPLNCTQLRIFLTRHCED
jgi:hypothetical protein